MVPFRTRSVFLWLLPSPLQITVAWCLDHRWTNPYPTLGPHAFIPMLSPVSVHITQVKFTKTMTQCAQTRTGYLTETTPFKIAFLQSVVSDFVSHLAHMQSSMHFQFAGLDTCCTLGIILHIHVNTCQKTNQIWNIYQIIKAETYFFGWVYFALQWKDIVILI